MSTIYRSTPQGSGHSGDVALLIVGHAAPEMWQQFVDARVRVLVDADEHVLKVRERVDAVRLARGDERVEASEVSARIVVADE
jgi:hypothetical protein